MYLRENCLLYINTCGRTESSKHQEHQFSNWGNPESALPEWLNHSLIYTWFYLQQIPMYNYFLSSQDQLDYQLAYVLAIYIKLISKIEGFPPRFCYTILPWITQVWPYLSHTQCPKQEYILINCRWVNWVWEETKASKKKLQIPTHEHNRMPNPAFHYEVSTG